MLAAEISTEHQGNASIEAHHARAERALVTIKVYTRHKRNCPKRDRSDWARCNCVKWLYIYRDGKCKLVSAKTRSWERAEQKAREVLDSYDPIRQLQRQLEAKSNDCKSQLEIAAAIEQFLQEITRLNRAEATRAKYSLTLSAFRVVRRPKRAGHVSLATGCRDAAALDSFLAGRANYTAQPAPARHHVLFLLHGTGLDYRKSCQENKKGIPRAR